jgi:hypothetical protein
MLPSLQSAVPLNSAARAQEGNKNINNFAQFQSDDEFGLFLNTRLRLKAVHPQDPRKRVYNYDVRPGAGIHNMLHHRLADDASPINVGDMRAALHNILYWLIHGE